jgi:hypothetical protein
LRDGFSDADVKRPQVSGHERRRFVLFESQFGPPVERSAPRHERLVQLLDAALQVVGHWCPLSRAFYNPRLLRTVAARESA